MAFYLTLSQNPTEKGLKDGKRQRRKSMRAEIDKADKKTPVSPSMILSDFFFFYIDGRHFMLDLAPNLPSDATSLGLVILWAATFRNLT